MLQGLLDGRNEQQFAHPQSAVAGAHPDGHDVSLVYHLPCAQKARQELLAGFPRGGPPGQQPPGVADEPPHAVPRAVATRVRVDVRIGGVVALDLPPAPGNQVPRHPVAKLAGEGRGRKHLREGVALYLGRLRRVLRDQRPHGERHQPFSSGVGRPLETLHGVPRPARRADIRTGSPIASTRTPGSAPPADSPAPSPLPGASQPLCHGSPAPTAPADRNFPS